MSNFTSKRSVQKNKPLNKSIVAVAIASTISFNSNAIADPIKQNQQCLTINECKKNDDSGKVLNNGAVFRIKSLENSEKLMANGNWTFHGLTPIKKINKKEPALEQKSLALSTLPHLNFSSGKHFISKAAKRDIDAIINKLKGKKMYVCTLLVMQIIND